MLALLAEWKCPISKFIIFDPIAIECGHTFERNLLVKWFADKDPCFCPMCQQESKVDMAEQGSTHAIKTAIRMVLKKLKSKSEVAYKKVVEDIYFDAVYFSAFLFCLNLSI